MREEGRKGGSRRAGGRGGEKGTMERSGAEWVTDQGGGGRKRESSGAHFNLVFTWPFSLPFVPPIVLTSFPTRHWKNNKREAQGRAEDHNRSV